MTIAEAYKNIVIVCQNSHGNKQYHDNLSHALELITEELNHLVKLRKEKEIESQKAID